MIVIIAIVLWVRNKRKHNEAEKAPENPHIEPIKVKTTTTKNKIKGDPGVYALQQKLISMGADIELDGIMGNETRKAMKEYGLDSQSATNQLKNQMEAPLNPLEKWKLNIDPTNNPIKAAFI